MRTVLTGPPRRRARLWPVVCLGLGVIWIVAAACPAAMTFDALLHSHPAYPVLLLVAALIGVVLLLIGVRRLRRPNMQTRPGVARRAFGVVGMVLLVVLTFILTAGLVAAAPRAATPEAVAAMAGSREVTVTEDTTSITLWPAARPEAGVGVIFQPGALVEARGYARILSAVARQGYPVVIVKQPLGLGFTTFGAAGPIMDAHPAIPRWVVAGHSLGGLPSARAAASGDPRIVGLSMWASYPDSATGVPAGVPIQMLYGTRDLLVPRSDIEPAAPRLPGARFIPIEGANHAYFGDYGTQSKDGTPTVDRDTAHAQIVTVLNALLDEVSAARH